MSLDWSDKDAWRDVYFDRAPRRLPRGYRSHARQAWDEEMARAEARERAFAASAAEHVQSLHVRELIEQLRPLVERFGSEAVEVIRRRTDPTFTLPATLRGIPPAPTQEED